MTPKERMQRAMRLQEPDRIPVMCQMSIGHMILQAGISPVELWFSASAFAEALCRLREIYGFDGILVNLHGHPPDWRKSARRVEQGVNEEVVIWKNGDRTVFPFDDLPRNYPRRPERPVSLADIDPERLPERLDFIPVSQGLDFKVDPEHPYAVFSAVREKAGSRYSIHGEAASPFDYFLRLFGFKQALIHLVRDPSRCRDILQRLTDGVRRRAADQAVLGVDAVKISSPYAGSGFLSPEFYARFVLPFERQVIRAVQELGIPAYLHTCGAVGDRLEIMADSGAAGLECLDPPPLGDVLLADAKKRVGARMFIKGNIDPVHVLLSGSVESVEREVRRCIAAGKPGGGYILSTACSIAPHTPRENVQVLVPLAEELGRY